jgi:hypothetical protein
VTISNLYVSLLSINVISEFVEPETSDDEVESIYWRALPIESKIVAYSLFLRHNLSGRRSCYRTPSSFVPLCVIER